MGWIYLNVQPSYSQILGGQDFERDLVSRDVHGRSPNILAVTIHPIEQGAYGRPVQMLTFECASYQRDRREWVYLPTAFRAELPYQPVTDFISSDKQPSMTNLLKLAHAQAPWVSFRYAWWEEPRWTMILCTGGMVLLVGGVWPTIIDLLIGAGLARPRRTREERRREKEYLARFGKGAADAQSGGPANEMTASEREQLADVSAKIEEDLSASDIPGEATAETTAKEEPVKTLDGGPLEASPASAEEEQKHYKGQYYPVALPPHRTKDNPSEE